MKKIDFRALPEDACQSRKLDGLPPHLLQHIFCLARFSLESKCLRSISPPILLGPGQGMF